MLGCISAEFYRGQMFYLQWTYSHIAILKIEYFSSKFGCSARSGRISAKSIRFFGISNRNFRQAIFRHKIGKIFQHPSANNWVVLSADFPTTCDYYGISLWQNFFNQSIPWANVKIQKSKLPFQRIVPQFRRRPAVQTPQKIKQFSTELGIDVNCSCHFLIENVCKLPQINSQ